MGERKPAHMKDDVPIIGDYSDAQNVRLRAESRRPPASARQPARAPGRPAQAASRSRDEALRPDPSDVRRHARLSREREHAGPLGKLVRYGLLAVVLAVAGAVYWNFDALRSATRNFSVLPTSFADFKSAIGEASITNHESSETDEAKAIDKPDAIDDPAATDVAVAASTIGASPPAPLPNATETAAKPLPAEESATPAPAESASVEAEPPTPSANADSPPASESSSASEPPPAPEPPPGPESFVFGSSVVNVSEADPSANVLILRNGDRRRRSSVTWWTEDGTATAGVDYANLGRVVVTFAPSEQNRTIHIPIARDGKVEGPETFYVHLVKTDDAAGSTEPEQRVEVIINDSD